jgi:RNA recognition motif-containing protein
MNIFVANLSFDANESDVKKLFEGFGNVVSVVIVMRKEKKAPKSRGFGFVQMPDEQQALAAIAALNGKEFMGRALDVNPARPKAEAQAENELKEKGQPEATVEAEQHPREEREEKKAWFKPVFNKPRRYKGGRRTHSYMKRRGLAGIQEEAKPRPRIQDNPMRWRKKKDQAKPWQKSPGEQKPWKKTEGEARPWKKPAGDAKPWSKSNGRPQKSRFKGSKNLDGHKRRS